MKLMVLDGNSIVNRAYYGVGKARLLTTRQGLHTNAIYGFVTMLQKLLDQLMREHGYSDEDAFLVLKDILAQLWTDGGR